MIPTIKVFFCLYADYFDLGEVTRRLGLTPTRAREKREWPQVSIELGIAANEWIFEVTEKQCYSVEIPFKKMIAILGQKTDAIQDLIREYGLEIGLGVIIQGEAVELPEMHLSEEIIAFAASIKASIGFDMYLD